MIAFSDYRLQTAKEILETLRYGRKAYGEIAECKIDDCGHAFIHFQEVGQAVLARLCFLKLLTKSDFIDSVDDISYFNNQDQYCALNALDWVITFYPLDLWCRIE